MYLREIILINTRKLLPMVPDIRAVILTTDMVIGTSALSLFVKNYRIDNRST